MGSEHSSVACAVLKPVLVIFEGVAGSPKLRVLSLVGGFPLTLAHSVALFGWRGWSLGVEGEGKVWLLIGAKPTSGAHFPLYG